MSENINKMFGVVSKKNNTPSFKENSVLPTTASSFSSFIKDAFINWPALGVENVLGLYPYELTITKIDSPNAKRPNVLSANFDLMKKNSVAVASRSASTESGGASQRIIKKFIFTLPPQAVSIQTTPAINVSVLQNGILEEHNAAPLRFIQITGTTGTFNSIFNFNAQNTNLNNTSPDFFKNLADAAQNLGKEIFFNTVQAVKGFGVLNKMTQKQSTLNVPISPQIFSETGFYEIHHLARFLDFYLALKKSPEGRSYRLHLNIYKDGLFYDVVPRNFTFRKNAGSMEYVYSLDLIAYKRRSTPAGSSVVPEKIVRTTTVQDPQGALSYFITDIERLKFQVKNFGNLFKGIFDDTNFTINTLIKSLSIVKNALGVGLSAAEAILSVPSAASFAFNQEMQEIFSTLKDLSDGGGRLRSMFAGSSSNAPPTNVFLATPTSVSEASSATSQSFLANVGDFLGELMDIPSESILWPDFAQSAIDNYQNNIQNIEVDDLIKIQNNFRQASNSMANKLGAFSDTYNRMYGFSGFQNEINVLEPEHIEVLATLNNFQLALDQIILQKQNKKNTVENNYALYYVTAARELGLEKLNDPRSKFWVPFPYDGTLEMLALTYLGDIDRWPEIAAINGLKPPYVDEVGFVVPLIQNGTKNTVKISNKDNLYVGQIVFVKSNTQKPKTVKILEITTISSQEHIVFFENDVNLDNFLVDDNAHIHAYLPHTVNSKKMIAIPSEIESTLSNFLINNFKNLEPAILLELAQTDFLLDNNNDIIIKPNGDIELARGMHNLVQAVKMNFLTPKGSIITQPDYGSGISVGGSVADFSATETIRIVQDMFKNDSRFSEVVALKTDLINNAVILNVIFKIAVLNKLLPITVELPLNK